LGGKPFIAPGMALDNIPAEKDEVRILEGYLDTESIEDCDITM